MKRTIRAIAYGTFAILLALAIWITFTPLAITQTQFYLYCIAILIVAAILCREN